MINDEQAKQARRRLLIGGRGRTSLHLLDPLYKPFSALNVGSCLLATGTPLSKGLGFSREDRDTNIKRIAFVCKLLTRNGVACITAAISPFQETRAWARKEIGNFVEVYVKCPIEVCRQRDIKGLYKLADAGIIQNFTGVSDPYEEPQQPELVVETDNETVEESATRILAKQTEFGYLEPETGAQGTSRRAIDAQAVPGITVDLLDSKLERETHDVRSLIAPHGGELVINMAGEAERAELEEHAQGLPQVVLGPRHLADLELLAVGAYSPLEGFMNHADYLSVVSEMHLGNGLPWSIPITLATSTEQAAALSVGSQLALVDAQGTLQAVMTLKEKYSYNKHLEAREVYRTKEDAHPGVKALFTDHTANQRC